MSEAIVEALPPPAEPVEYAAADPAPPPPAPKPTKMDKEDQLELENLQLKLTNVQLQLQIMQSDLQKALQERNNLVEKMKSARTKHMEKYGVDISQIKLGEDGTIIKTQGQ